MMDSKTMYLVVVAWKGRKLMCWLCLQGLTNLLTARGRLRASAVRCCVNCRRLLQLHASMLCSSHYVCLRRPDLAVI